MEGLGFSSLLYMALLWLRIFQWILDFPMSVKKKMNPQLEGFRDFFNDPTADNYLKCIFDEISKTSSHAGPSKSNIKRHLADIIDSDESDNEAALPPIPRRFPESSDEKEEQVKQKKKTFSHKPVLPAMPTFHASNEEEEVPKGKKKKSKKNKKQKL